jgi:hypothetical protein
MGFPTDVKLPSSLGGFVLIFHSILLFFLVFYNCNYKPSSFIFSFAVSGIIIGGLLYYQVEPYLKYKYKRVLGVDVFGRMCESLVILFVAMFFYLLLGGIIRALIIMASGLP